MSIPLVSVIITAYNCEKFLEESLNSIFYQTFKDFEIIFYEDASTDKTWQVALDLFKNSKSDFIGARLIHSGDKNVGCGEGRNRAIKEARGKYIAIQDADDISFQHRLEKEVDYLEEHDDVFCVDFHFY